MNSQTEVLSLSNLPNLLTVRYAIIILGDSTESIKKWVLFENGGPVLVQPSSKVCLEVILSGQGGGSG